MDSFNFYKNDIKKLCKSFAARAYINLNRKSHRSVAFHMLELMALYIREGDTPLFVDCMIDVAG